MKFKTILVWLSGGSGDDVAMQVAVDLAKTCSCHVEGLHVTQPLEALTPVLGEQVVTGVGNGYLETAEREAHEKLERAKATFDSHCRRAGFPVIAPGQETGDNVPGCSWWDVSGYDGPELAVRGRTSDLIIMARPDINDGGVDAETLEAALFESARPVLVVGEKAPSISDLHILIAWDGSREAALSTGFSIPLLQQAKHVAVLNIDQAKSNTNPEEKTGVDQLGDYLARHNVSAETKRIHGKSGEVASILLDQVSKNMTNLVIMGAYGHSQLSEYLFGGVSRSLLSNPAISVFMAH